MPAVKRKFAYIGAGWVAGLLLFLGMGTAAALGMPAALAAACAIHIGQSRTVTKPCIAAKHIMLISLSALAGAMFFICFTSLVYAPVTSLAGSRVVISGTVTDCADVKGGRTRLTVSGRIGGRRAKAVIFTRERFLRGERVTAEFDAEIPANTDSFDAEDYYRSLGIFLTGSGSAERTGRNAVICAAGALRKRALDGIYESCGSETGAFLASVLCSDKSRLGGETRTALYRAGIGHIFAVSGTHIVMLMMFLSPLLGRLIFPLRLRNAVTGVIIVMFAVFAGGSLPVVRACIMVGISLAAPFFYRQSDSANSLGLAAFLVTLAEPFAVTGVSFWLSFTAAAAFGVLAPAMTEGRTEHPMIKHITACVCVNVLTLPVCALSFGEISLISAVSNILLIPLCTVCLLLALLFAASGGLLTPVILAADMLAGVIIKLCELVTASPYSYASTAESAGLLAFWGLAASALFVVCALVRERRPADLAKCGAVYLLISVLAAII